MKRLKKTIFVALVIAASVSCVSLIVFPEDHKTRPKAPYGRGNTSESLVLIFDAPQCGPIKTGNVGELVRTNQQEAQEAFLGLAEEGEDLPLDDALVAATHKDETVRPKKQGTKSNDTDD